MRGLLLLGVLLIFSRCTRVNQPVDPVDPVIIEIDSCINSPINSSPAKNILEKPVFSILADSLGYGTKVYLLPDTVVNDAIFEISIDSGKNWIPAKCFSLSESGEIWARRRNDKLTSQIVKKSYTIYYERVLIVGNSITGHGPAPELGWTGDWGMAASSAEKDYLHIISKKLKLLNPKVEIKINYAVDFERTYSQFDFNSLETYADFKPDLVIMRIAENTDMDYVYNYETSYANYIAKLTSKTNAKVICTTSFWSSTAQVTPLIRNVASNKGYKLVDLTPLWSDNSYTAIKLFANSSVGAHPSDKGMQAIANRISVYF
ncbi:MAG: SGNH/GDSL hydrolase family protein [Dyadobacter sp.]